MPLRGDCGHGRDLFSRYQARYRRDKSDCATHQQHFIVRSKYCTCQCFKLYPQRNVGGAGLVGSGPNVPRPTRHSIKLTVLELSLRLGHCKRWFFVPKRPSTTRDTVQYPESWCWYWQTRGCDAPRALLMCVVGYTFGRMGIVVPSTAF